MKESPNALIDTEDFEMQALSLADNYRAALLREFSKFLRGSVLEVGAGIGQITEALLKVPGISRLVSVEPHPGFYRELLKKFPGHTVVEGTIDNLKEDDHWDTIVSINVLEHIEWDQVELKKYHRQLLKNSGTLCLFVPARQEIYGQLDKDFGHFRRYTRPELRQKLLDAGFEILRLRYYNIAGYFAWGLMIHLLGRRHFNPDSIRFFDRFIFPPVHGFESHVCPPFIGQSLLALARAK
jgi:SAM-dependent methyltransferase